jgi:acyl-CoA reductase-like NAD-dependent aldehyde dehydrogenase
MKSHRVFNVFAKKRIDFVEVENPYTQEIIAEAPFMTQEEVKVKLAQAQEAQVENKRRPLAKRKEIVMKIIDHLLANKETIAQQITE